MDSKRKSTQYSIAALAAVLALLLRLLLSDVVGPNYPYITFFPAVLISAWHGGLGPGLLCTALSGLAAIVFVVEPNGSLYSFPVSDRIGLTLFASVGAFLSWASQLMRNAEAAERRHRLLSQQTLASIADAVVAVDQDRRVTFLNTAAAELTGWSPDAAAGKQVNEIFRAVDEENGQAINPIDGALNSGTAQSRANHTSLVTRDGRQRPVEASAAPIRDMNGELVGAVLVFRDVSERMQAEKALLESRERLSMTLESIGDAFMALDSGWHFTYVNAAAERWLGKSRVTLLGQNHWDVYPDMLGTELAEHYQVVMRDRKAEAFEFYSERSHRWLEVNAYPADDGGLSIYFRDITQRRKADAELARSRAEAERARDLLQTTLASIGDGVIATAVDGRVTFLNAVAASLTGVTPSEAIGRRLDEVFVIVSEDTREPVENPASRAIRDGVIVGLANHTILIAKDGRETPIDDSAAPIRNMDEEIIGAVLVFRDVSARRASEKALRQSEERLRLALRVGEVGVWDWDIRADRIEWDDRVYVMHGIPPGEFSGRVEDFIPLIHPDDREKVKDAIRAALEEGSQYQVQLRALHPDGKSVWLETTAQVIRDDSGRPLRMLGATTEITNRIRADAEMRQQARELQRSNSDLERFAFAASHDLQEPLRMITIYSQLLSRRCQDGLDEDSTKYIEIILDGTQRMRNLIQDLLAYSQVTHEQHAVEPVHAGTVLKQVLQNCEAAVKEGGACIECGPLPVVHARESQLAQVFQNLILNAIRYRSAAPPRIKVSAEQGVNEWTFAVRDNGIGIPPQQHRRVFELFKRLDSKSAGTGIGLALCQRIVDGHGGRIWVESNPGQGSTFFFTLPHASDAPFSNSASTSRPSTPLKD